MPYVDAIYDALFFSLALIFVVIVLMIVMPMMSEQNVEGEVKQDLKYMQVQEFTLAFMKNYDSSKNDATTFEILSDYYSQQSQDTVYIEGEGYPRQDIVQLLKERASSMRIPENWYLHHIRLPGDEFSMPENWKYGLVMPVPDAQGEVNKVWAW